MMGDRRTTAHRRHAACLATLAGILLAACSLVPASAQAGTTKTFRPVHKTRHALVFAPRSVRDADAVVRARVRLRNRRTHALSLRRVSARRVRKAIERSSRLRVKKPKRARGKLKLKLKNPPGIPPPPPPPSDGTIPSSWTRFASFESNLNAGTDHGWRIDSPFSVTRTSEVGGTDGTSAAKIVTNGGNTGCSCPRMTYENGFSYGAGADVWIGGSWRVGDPAKLAWSRLMNLGHYEGSADPDNWYLALMVRNSGMEVVARRFDTDSGSSVLMQPRAIPQGRWFSVDIHLRLSHTAGQALTEVYLDGSLVASTTARNMMAGGPLHFYNAGLPYFWNGNGKTTVYFDEPRLVG
jgi:hypothetical protein